MFLAKQSLGKLTLLLHGTLLLLGKQTPAVGKTVAPLQVRIDEEMLISDDDDVLWPVHVVEPW